MRSWIRSFGLPLLRYGPITEMSRFSCAFQRSTKLLSSAFPNPPTPVFPFRIWPSARTAP